MSLHSSPIPTGFVTVFDSMSNVNFIMMIMASYRVSRMAADLTFYCLLGFQNLTFIFTAVKSCEK